MPYLQQFFSLTKRAFKILTNKADTDAMNFINDQLI